MRILWAKLMFGIENLKISSGKCTVYERRFVARVRLGGARRNVVRRDRKLEVVVLK
jgi:hypothetical protein